MNVGEKFIQYLEANPKASATVVEGNHTKSIMFDDALLVQTSDVTLVRIGDEIFETHVSFYDKIFELLQKLPLMN